MGTKQKSEIYTVDTPIIMEAVDLELASEVVEKATPKGLNVLDVGCGANPRGNVNCDLYRTDNLGHRNLGADSRINSKAIPNFILCSALNLPFKDDFFDVVLCSQVIEHTDKPFSLLKELIRVSTLKVIVETVHRLGDSAALSHKRRVWIKKHHISKFNFRWFEKASKSLGCYVANSRILGWEYFPARFLPLVQLPNEIRVEIVKGVTRVD